MHYLVFEWSEVMLCKLCEGTGNHVCIQNGQYEWWVCQACGGCGVRAQFGPARIAINEKQSKMSRKFFNRVVK